MPIDALAPKDSLWCLLIVLRAPNQPIAYARKHLNLQVNYPSYKMKNDLPGPPYACLLISIENKEIISKKKASY